MSTTTETTRRLLVLLGALALGGCDGGIFGTGDGPDVIVPGPDASVASGGDDAGSLPASTGNGGASVEGADDAGDSAPGASDSGAQGTDVDDTGGTTDGAFELDSSPTAEIPAASGGALENRVPEPSGTAAGPRVRLVNASPLPLALAADLGEGSLNGASSGPVPPRGASAYVTLSDGAESLVMTRDVGEPGTVADDPALYRLAPLDLAPTSVTTVFARAPVARTDASVDGGIEVMTLPTRTTSDDPSQALVRVVDATVAADPAAEPATYALVTGGVDPSGVTVELASVPFGAAAAPDATTAPAYVPVPPGDYRLAGPDDATVSDSLSFAADEVRTLVVIGGGRPPIVVDDGGR